MDETTFRTRMLAVDHDLQAGELQASLAAAEALRTDLHAEPIVDGDQACWALYYALRALHGLERWDDVVDLMEKDGILLVPIGARNHAYGASLVMEASVRAGRPELLPKWAEACLLGRLRTNDKQSFQQAIRTALTLAGMTDPEERTEHRAAVFDALARAAEQQDMARLAGEAREEAAALRSGARG